MSKKNNTSIISNMIWKFSERITAQVVTLIVSVVLARMLEPSHYGVIAMVNVFIAFANIFVSDGLGSALIQKKETDELDYSSVLYFNIFISVLLYFLLYFLAPFISLFYGEGYEILTPVIRVLSLRLIFSAINSVQQAYVSKKMIFRKFFLATLLGTVVSAVVGIVLAYKGFGVWALVAQYLTNTTVDTVVLALSLGKKPILKFSFYRLKGLFGFGMRILGTNLLITGYQELRTLIIGKVYTSNELAYYDRGKQFPNLIVTNINASISAVLFPKMSNEQDNIVRVKMITRNSIRYSSFIMCPMMLGLAATAPSLIKVLLTGKWLDCVPLLQLFCIVFLFQPIHSANMQAIKALGKGDIYLKLEITKKIIELVVLLATIQISVKAMVIGMAVSTTLFTFLNAYPNIKLLNYSLREQLKDIKAPCIMSIIMFLVVYGIGHMIKSPIIQLFVQIMSGICIYIFLCTITQNAEFKHIVSSVKNQIKNEL